MSLVRKAETQKLCGDGESRSQFILHACRGMGLLRTCSSRLAQTESNFVPSQGPQDDGHFDCVTFNLEDTPIRPAHSRASFRRPVILFETCAATQALDSHSDFWEPVTHTD